MGLESHSGKSTESTKGMVKTQVTGASLNLETSSTSLENVSFRSTFSTKTKIPKGILQGEQ